MGLCENVVERTLRGDVTWELLGPVDKGMTAMYGGGTRAKEDGAEKEKYIDRLRVERLEMTYDDYQAEVEREERAAEANSRVVERDLGKSKETVKLHFPTELNITYKSSFIFSLRQPYTFRASNENRQCKRTMGTAITSLPNVEFSLLPSELLPFDTERAAFLYGFEYSVLSSTVENLVRDRKCSFDEQSVVVMSVNVGNIILHVRSLENRPSSSCRTDDSM
eukprot:IDg3481t1